MVEKITELSQKAQKPPVPQSDCFASWFKTVQVEHFLDLQLSATGIVQQVVAKSLTSAVVLLKLQPRAKRKYRAWHEKVTDKELLRSPELFGFEHKKTKVSGDISNVEPVGPLLRVSIITFEEPLEVSVGDTLRIIPATFLLKLYERMLGRSADPKDAIRDYSSEVRGRLSQCVLDATTLPLASTDGGASLYQALEFPFRPGQAAAIEAGKALDISIIMGPPGTGKTHTLGHLVAQLTTGENPQKVLALSLANRGIEQMLLKADEAYQQLTGSVPNKGFLLRTQVPHNPELKQRPHLTAWSELERELEHTLQEFKVSLKYLRVVHQQKQTEAEKLTTLEEIEGVRQSMQAVIFEYKLKRAKLISESQAIFCSVNQHSWDPDLRIDYDVVILEEASMIPSYYVMDIMEAHPKARFIIAGDPKQLPPIYNRRKHEDVTWVNSPFELLNGSDLARYPDRSRLDPDATLSAYNFLDVQSRMPFRLGEAISETFYDGRLRSSREEGELDVVEGWPHAELLFIHSDHAIPWLDEQGYDPQLPADLDYDNTDENEAFLSILLAEQALKSGVEKVLIITPYRNQHALISTLIKERDLDRTKCDCSTVHSAQGSEAPVVIFSPVNPGSSFLSNEVGFCLINVAMSRAQQQLVFISDGQNGILLHHSHSLLR